MTECLPSENAKRPNIQIFIECLDLLNAEFTRRFSTENIALLEAMSALSPSSDVYLKYDILKPLFEYATTKLRLRLLFFYRQLRQPCCLILNGKKIDWGGGGGTISILYISEFILYY